MSARLAGTRALVTGAARGIGAAIARELASQGAQVLVSDRNLAGAQTVAQEIGGHACRLDVTREADWREVLASAEQRMGGLSLLVNNAGIAVGGTVEETTPEQWRLCFAVNVEGAYLGCRLALPLLRAHGAGAGIVNIASIAAHAPRPDLAAYGASKAALLALTRAVAVQVAGEGIRCNAVVPAYVDSAMLDGWARASGTPRAELAGDLARQVPLGRIATVRDVAQAVAWLAGPESGFATGTEIRLDGGMTARGA